MAPLHLLDKVLEGNTVEPELAPAVVGELTDILEKSGPSAPTDDPETAHWYYSVPMAGARYYGFQSPLSQRTEHEVSGQ